jgi:ATP-dependent DNA helicase RecQ
LLGYFGETTEPCGNCDICLDPIDMADGTVEGQKILATVHRTGQRFGAAHIVDVLRGSVTEKVSRAGHDRLPTFGVGADRKVAEWHSLIRQLVAAGFLNLDIQGYGGLVSTDKGSALLRGEGDFQYRRDALPQTAPASRKSKAKVEGEPLSVEQEALLDRLKRLRLELAKARGVPAYVIFPDRALADMARRNPRTVDEFADVNGVGEAKLKDFAAPFLAVIAGAEDETMPEPADLGPPPDRLDDVLERAEEA